MEFDGAWSPYYFFTDNCAVQLLTLLEVGKPDLNLVQHFAYVFIPLDTVKVVARQPGLVKSKKYRKSLKTDYVQSYLALNSKQKDALKKIIMQPSSELPSLSREESAKVLEAGMKYYSLQSYQEGLPFEEQKYNLSVARARIGKIDQAEQRPAIAPDLSHDSAAVYLGGGEEGSTPFSSFKFRWAFHDITSPDEALIQDSQNVSMTADLRYYALDTRLDVHRLTVVDLLTTKPINELEKPLSWKVQLYTEPKLSPVFQTGFGYSVDTKIFNHTRLVAMLSAISESGRQGAGPEFMTITRPTKDLGIFLNYQGSATTQDYRNDYTAQLGYSFIKDLEAQLQYQKKGDAPSEWQARLFHEFIF